MDIQQTFSPIRVISRLIWFLCGSFIELIIWVPGEVWLQCWNFKKVDGRAPRA
jgi:hypothetical protein